MNRELNARVAVKIFGWTRPLNESGHRMEDVWWRDPEGSYSPSPPAYSSEWAAVGELWNKLHADRYVLSVLNTIEPALPCHIEVNGHVANGEFCEALCQAALKAKEEEG